MKWLLTGGCGFIGCALIEDLLGTSDNQVRVLDNLCVGTRENLADIAPFEEVVLAQASKDWSSPLQLVVGDITDDITASSSVVGADVVVHLAANTGVAPSIEDPRKDCITNVNGTLNMLEACRTHDVKRFVMASSGAPLGVQTPPLHEGLSAHPASPYGASKLAGEGYCSAYFHSFGIDAVALRFGNVYGRGSGHKQSVVAKFIKQALAGEMLVLNGDGSQTRDFIYISDLLDAIKQASVVDGIGGEVFQIATAKETTVQELTNELLDVLEMEGIKIPETTFGEPLRGDVQRNFSDTSKAKKMLNWTAQVPLREGLKRTLTYFKHLV